MPRRTDLRRILIIGSGPIVIGQACEFDYSGTQACKALRAEGYEVILVNSNPATIMTDPETADRVYIEPITPDDVAAIIAAEKPCALLPTLGGQTALNTALALADRGVLQEHGVELIGASVAAIRKAEDREAFRDAMAGIGLDMPRSRIARSIADVEALAAEYGYPLILRPSFTLGGSGGSIAYAPEELADKARVALDTSPTHEVLVDESILGWKEYELEVMRDHADNVVIICSIENLDPMGVHTGDSITVAPAQTLTDREYQHLRDAAIACIREIGVDTGGSNVQFGVCPETGRVVIIEMNPRVSRSSALASKATGYPIAKIAALLAVGYTLDELHNDITRTTPASFEPTIDYVVTKIPRFTFEKFPGTPPVLGTQMKSVGEAMAIGRTFTESLQKALRSLETDLDGLDERLWDPADAAGSRAAISEALARPHPERILFVADAMRAGLDDAELFARTALDPWFLARIREIVDAEVELRAHRGERLDPQILRAAKRMGFSDRRLAHLLGATEDTVRGWRRDDRLRPVYKRVDTCAAEFEAHTPYLYSTYETEDEAAPTDRKKVIILGGGPNRIGQGIEFDYCCVHAVQALAADGYETIMVNCNPETVSTDYDTSDRLYFEPLTFEDVLHIVEHERPLGVIVQFGGQTPLKLARRLEAAGVPILGTPPDAIDRAEDRERFNQLIDQLGLRQPAGGVARSEAEALAVARRIGFPLVVRPSYVLGGRAMEIVSDEDALRRYIKAAVKVSPDHPVLLDQFVDGAIELDVDCVCDGKRAVIGGIMEHVEEAGIHSGDSACSLPPYSVPRSIIDQIRTQTRALALELGVVGLMNVQFAVRFGTHMADEIYVIEVNPRASRTVPFVSKAIGRPLAKIAARVMGGKTLAELGVEHELQPRHMSVKEAVFPFNKFGEVDTLLGPEMKSTGEVMGIGDDFPTAFLKSQAAAFNTLPARGGVLISVDDADKPGFVHLARRLAKLGFTLLTTRGTHDALAAAGIQSACIAKEHEGGEHTVKAIAEGRVQLVFCTTRDAGRISRSRGLRRGALRYGVPYYTTYVGARAAVAAIERLVGGRPTVRAIQDYHAEGGTR
ncbi:MAG: carbamoyl-phosphate synthase large subunit [Myxococcales bacterium]|nr:carbamoyl-phosphate synthase large subunit [Myxococcales bacterium]